MNRSAARRAQSREHTAGLAPAKPLAETPAPPPTGAAALRRAVSSPEALAAKLGAPPGEIKRAAAGSRLRVPLYYLSLIREEDDPIRRQAVPSAEELREEALAADPFAEDDPRHAPVPHLTHRYPDRALLLVTGLCPMTCRFCMRRRKTLHGEPITPAMVSRAIAHVRKTPAIREVILSGGDPLMLSDARLDAILDELRGIPHVERLRIHTRMPCVEPGRITEKLAALLAARRPLTIGVHFNHPREVTPHAPRALALLADAGLPLVNQTVLLKGVNDDARLLAELFRALMRCRVHPYYLHHTDLIPGTAHFRLSVPQGMAVVRELRELAPELSMLHYVLDTPGGGGKVPLG